MLARKVLAGFTNGYKNHPQLVRFRQTQNPLESIDAFLSHVLIESQRRCYRFEKSKIQFNPLCEIMKVNAGQLEYEFEHLRSKLEKRDKVRFDVLSKLDMNEILPNPVFKIISAGIESWEKLAEKSKKPR